MLQLTLSKMGLLVLTGLIVLVSGFILYRGGKPYQTALFTVHKLIALAGLVGLVLFARQIHPAGSMPWDIPAVLILLAVGFILTFVSGGLISGMQKAPVIIRLLHPLGVVLIVAGVPTLLILLEKAGLLKTSF